MVHANPMDTTITPSRLITDDVFLAHLQCPYKAYLKLAGDWGAVSDHERFDQATLEAYRSRAIERMLAGTSPNDVTDYAESSIRSLPTGPPLLLHGTLRSQKISSHIDALEKVPRKQAYAPVIFSSSATISSVDRLLLGFKSLALAAVQGKDGTMLQALEF